MDPIGKSGGEETGLVQSLKKEFEVIRDKREEMDLRR